MSSSVTSSIDSPACSLRHFDRIGFVVQGSIAPYVVMQEYKTIAVFVFGVAYFVQTRRGNHKLEVAELAVDGTPGGYAAHKFIHDAARRREAPGMPDEGFLIIRVLVKRPFQHHVPIEAEQNINSVCLKEPFRKRCIRTLYFVPRFFAGCKLTKGVELACLNTGVRRYTASEIWSWLAFNRIPDCQPISFGLRGWRTDWKE